jgi:hypothetical protein
LVASCATRSIPTSCNEATVSFESRSEATGRLAIASEARPGETIDEQLLKDRSWFDIPIVYTNGVRAVLAMEKGSQGDRTFAEVFAAWEKK